MYYYFYNIKIIIQYDNTVWYSQKMYSSATCFFICAELPQVKLSIESQWNIFYPTEKVTLKCSVDEDSNKWGYEWFRNRAQLINDKDISLSENTLSISSAKASDSGQYTCRGRHLKRTTVTTGETEAVQLLIQGKTTYYILWLININESDKHQKEFNEKAVEYFELLLKIWYTTWFIWKKELQTH